MNREIKFRAWNTKSKEMFSAETMAEDQLTLLPTGQFINVHSHDTRLSIIYPLDTMIPMQFTGLLDKNGKEIYESDYVQVDGDTYIVFWDNKKAGWECENKLGARTWLAVQPKDIEVVGNKFEGLYNSGEGDIMNGDDKDKTGSQDNNQ